MKATVSIDGAMACALSLQDLSADHAGYRFGWSDPTHGQCINGPRPLGQADSCELLGLYEVECLVPLLTASRPDIRFAALLFVTDDQGGSPSHVIRDRRWSCGANPSVLAPAKRTHSARLGPITRNCSRHPTMSRSRLTTHVTPTQGLRHDQNLPHRPHYSRDA